MFKPLFGRPQLNRARLPLRCLMFLGLCWASVCGATTVVPPEFPALVNESDYIVHAVVKSVSSEKKPTARGSKIVTRVEIDVIEVVAGKPPADVVLEFLGGRVGEEEMRVEGMPKFKVGEENILFVRDNGRSICPLYGMMHGRYAIDKTSEKGRKRVMRSDGLPLRNTSQIAAPLLNHAPAEIAQSQAAATALEPAEFIRQIRAGVRPNTRINRAN